MTAVFFTILLRPFKKDGFDVAYCTQPIDNLKHSTKYDNKRGLTKKSVHNVRIAN